MPHLASRPWVPTETFIQALAERTATQTSAEVDARLDDLIERNIEIHEHDCFNLNPATNVMNPRAEAALSRRLGSRPSLGYPGDKYEMGLEAIEEIEVIAAELAAEMFEAKYAEIRVGSGALANLYGFMALAKPGRHDHRAPGEHRRPCHPSRRGLRRALWPRHPRRAGRCRQLYASISRRCAPWRCETRPVLITVGGSLNLFPHPVREVRAIADEIGAKVLFDAAHQCGMIAGKSFPNPLAEGAHLMTMSTYKSLGGPAGGLIVTNDAAIAQRLDAIAFPGLTANFDAAKSAALAITLLDWREFGRSLCAADGRDGAGARRGAGASRASRSTAPSTASPARTSSRSTPSHSAAVRRRRRRCARPASWPAASACRAEPSPGDMNGLRIGTPELVRWGMTEADMPQLAALIAEGLRANDPESVAPRTAAFRQHFRELHYIRQ